MKKEEKEVLQKISSNKKGLLSQSDLLNCLSNSNTKISHRLITSGLIEETTRRIKATQVEATFYRITEKGMIALAPLYKQLWFSIKEDLRNIIVSAITAIITTIIAILITNYYGK